ncbi:MAG: ABC transporter ATP-binding protein [Spirochaetales bacterium]|nr:ABC transporter ATP-binding protein [Spirochaetales bacterium]
MRNISFSIEKGEIFGFLGPSGAGKSTTQKILIGILKKYSGKVSVYGSEISQVSGDFYNNIGVSFEFPNLYSKLTGRENLDFFTSLYKTTRNRTDELLDMVDLSDAADKRVSDYSKGMKMRLNFCRSLVHDPEIIFFDEPTSGLDPLNGKRIKDIINDLKNQGKTIFLTTHNMNVAEELCDRVAFIVDGELSLIDSPRQLKIDNGEKSVRLEYQNRGKTVHRDFRMATIGSDPEFLQFIRDEKIETIHSKEASLEDIFIRTTGRKLDV